MEFPMNGCTDEYTLKFQSHRNIEIYVHARAQIHEISLRYIQKSHESINCVKIISTALIRADCRTFFNSNPMLPKIIYVISTHIFLQIHKRFTHIIYFRVIFFWSFTCKMEERFVEMFMPNDNNDEMKFISCHFIFNIEMEHFGGFFCFFRIQPKWIERRNWLRMVENNRQINKSYRIWWTENTSNEHLIK